MLGKSRKNRQLDMYDVPMKDFIDDEHSLVDLSSTVEWDQLEKKFNKYYSDKGRPSVTMRKIIGLMLLKERYSISDEKALDIWIENPYWQHFCGEIYFQHQRPFSSGEFARFRKRVGDEGLIIIEDLCHSLFGELEDKTYNKYEDRQRRTFWDWMWGG